MNPHYQHVTIEKSLSSEFPLFLCQRQEIRQVIFNVLLFHLPLEQHQDKTLLLKTHVLKSATGDAWMQMEFWDKEITPSVDVLLPSFHTERNNLVEVEKRDLGDEGLVIAEEIIETYGGYIQVYRSVNEPVLQVISLPVKAEEVVTQSLGY